MTNIQAEHGGYRFDDNIHANYLIVSEDANRWRAVWTLSIPGSCNDFIFIDTKRTENGWVAGVQNELPNVHDAPSELNAVHESVCKLIRECVRKVTGINHCELGHSKQVSENDVVFTIEEFREMCNDGAFIDDDGYGYYLADKNISNEMVRPSDFVCAPRRKYKWIEKFTHIVWYNR